MAAKIRRGMGARPVRNAGSGKHGQARTYMDRHRQYGSAEVRGQLQIVHFADWGPPRKPTFQPMGNVGNGRQREYKAAGNAALPFGFAKRGFAVSVVVMHKNSLDAQQCAEAARKSQAVMHDKQNERDTRELRIDKVGVRGLRFPIQIRDKARSIQNTVATIGMFVDLPKEFKGTHMSRFIEVLNAHGNVIHVENIPDILRSLQKKLNASTSHIEIEFPYFMSKRSPVSRGESLMDYLARFDAAAVNGAIDFILTVK